MRKLILIITTISLLLGFYSCSNDDLGVSNADFNTGQTNYKVDTLKFTYNSQKYETTYIQTSDSITSYANPEVERIYNEIMSSPWWGAIVEGDNGVTYYINKEEFENLPEAKEELSNKNTKATYSGYIQFFTAKNFNKNYWYDTFYFNYNKTYSLSSKVAGKVKSIYVKNTGSKIAYIYIYRKDGTGTVPGPIIVKAKSTYKWSNMVGYKDVRKVRFR